MALANGTTLGYKETAESTDYTILSTLKAVPDLGGDPEKIENTTLDANYLQYDIGVGDAGDLEYTFKYMENTADSETRKILTLSDAKNPVQWEHTLPDGTAYTFTATPSARITGGALNDPTEIIVTMGLESDMVREDPAGL